MNKIIKTGTLFFFIMCFFHPGEVLSNVSNGEKQLVILVTSDTKGQIWPDRVCGSELKYVGGLARRAEMVEQIKEVEPDSLLLDNGGLFLGEKFIVLPEKANKDAEIIFGVYKKMGYDAFTLSEDDLNSGVDFLESLQYNSELNLVTSNLLLRKNKKTIGKRYILAKKGGVTFGIVSILDLYEPDKIGKEVLDSIIIQPPLETLEDIVAEIKDQVDFVILLSRLKMETSGMLADTNDNIHLVVNRAPTSPGKFYISSVKGKTITPKRGYFVTISKLKIRENGDVVENKTNNLPLDHTIEENLEVRKLISDIYFKEIREKIEEEKRKNREAVTTGIHESLKSEMELSPQEYLDKMMEQQK